MAKVYDLAKSRQYFILKKECEEYRSFVSRIRDGLVKEVGYNNLKKQEEFLARLDLERISVEE